MSTLTKSRAKKPVRKTPARALHNTPTRADWGIPEPIAPPPAKHSAADLLADVRSGEFGKNVDFSAVARAYKSRRRSPAA